MNNKNSDIKSIQSLFGLDFVIPSYQRGYRWDENQVTDLLNDIWEFQTSGKAGGEFYCLQPIIIKKDEEKYKLVDGQQRLTTILIMLSLFKGYMKDNNYECFTLDYETRNNSKEFLANIDNTEEINKENPDFYYMSRAYLTIKKWFSDNQKEVNKIDFFNCLTKEIIDNEKDVANNVRIIWYEIGSDEDEIKVFNRINSGKIPLNDAELIKALLLNKKNFANDSNVINKYELAKEWDEMEYYLQNNEFWFFLCDKNQDKDKSSRIVLLFEIFYFIEKEKPSNVNNYEIYRCFHEKAKNDSEVSSIVGTWSSNPNNIKKIFLTLKYWFEDKKLYHLIGFLLITGYLDLNNLYKNFNEMTKKAFSEFLLKKIKEKIIPETSDPDTYLKNLTYDDNKEVIKEILILFNIATILNNKDSYIKFSFDQFKNNKWSLEHIHAVNQDNNGFKGIEAKKNFLSGVQKEIEKMKKLDVKEEMASIKSLSEEIESLSKKIETLSESEKITDDEFNPIQEEIFTIFSGGGDSYDDSISNLTLLTNKDNSSLNNSIFPVKRNLIKEKDADGSFVPICTKNVFMKYYSEDIQHMQYWAEQDKESYLQQIKNTIGDFVDVKF